MSRGCSDPSYVDDQGVKSNSPVLDAHDPFLIEGCIYSVFSTRILVEVQYHLQLREGFDCLVEGKFPCCS